MPTASNSGSSRYRKHCPSPRAADLDLVEVAPDANPPVCRIMNFTKFKYEAQQRAKESRKKATNITVKEMKYRPKIGGGDFDTKTRKVAQFLGEGHKVKVTIMFRGREMQHPELGRRILDRVAGEVEHLGRVEIMPKQDGRNMTMVLGPDKKAQAAFAKKQQTDEPRERHRIGERRCAGERHSSPDRHRGQTDTRPSPDRHDSPDRHSSPDRHTRRPDRDRPGAARSGSSARGTDRDPRARSGRGELKRKPTCRR